jgi:hypothetical protein
MAERGKNYKTGPAKADVAPSRNGFFHSNGTEAGPSKPSQQSTNDVEEDGMVVDERYTPVVQIVHDPIQEQLAMEMAEGEEINGS